MQGWSLIDCPINETKLKLPQDYQNIFAKLDDNQLKVYINDKQLFPFSCSNSRYYYAVLMRKEKQQHSPVIEISFYYQLNFLYRNLTAMMQTFAEYLETGAYYLDEEGFQDGDEEKMLPIFQKYNPGLELIG